MNPLDKLTLSALRAREEAAYFRDRQVTEALTAHYAEHECDGSSTCAVSTRLHANRIATYEELIAAMQQRQDAEQGQSGVNSTAECGR